MAISINYDLNSVVTSHLNFDERKIGLYKASESGLEYVGGEGGNGQVITQLNKSGTYIVKYNPEHEFLPKSIELAQNYPNPFNPSTTIRFGLREGGKVRITVYNLLGQKVRELLNTERSAGFHTITWNGKNELGEQVASGLYIYRLENSLGIQSRKMLLIK